MRSLLTCAIAAWLTASAAAAGQNTRFIDGLFVHTAESVGSAPVELIAYAELTGSGMLRMIQGDLEDAPLVSEVRGILCSIPYWRPVFAMVTTTALFRDERSEWRQLSIATAPRNIYAMEVRVADLESRARIDALLRSVRASAETPGYAFLVLDNAGYRRYYPIRLSPIER